MLITDEGLKKEVKNSFPVLQDINVFAARNSNDRSKDGFNDLFGTYSNTKNDLHIYRGTTEPGKKAFLSGGYTKKGAPILIEGFHEKFYCIDKHAGKYEALCSRPEYGCSLQEAYRDANKNFIIDDMEKKILEGNFRCNLHRSSVRDRIYIGPYSAGCQVLQYIKDFNELIKNVKDEPMYYSVKEKTLYNYLLTNYKDGIYSSLYTILFNGI